MLDLTLYSQDKEEAEVVEVSAEFYEWLAKSEFSKIGKSRKKEMKSDGEPVKVSVIELGVINRRKLSKFLRDAIVQEDDEMLNRLGNSPSTQEFQDATAKLIMLQNLRKSIENEHYKYLQRA